MRLKRTLLWARLRSLRTYVKVVLRHFNVHFPYNQPKILGGTPDYLTAVILYDADLSKAQKFFYRQNTEQLARSTELLAGRLVIRFGSFAVVIYRKVVGML